jgi:uncharacterized protein
MRTVLGVDKRNATANAAYIFGMMWVPGVAAILTCRVVRRPLSSLGLGRWNGRFVLIGYPIPIAYCLVASLAIWILGFGGFPNSQFVRQTADAFGVGGAPDWAVIAMFVVLTGTTGMIAGIDVGAAVAKIFCAKRRDVTAPVDNSSAPAR